MHSRSPIKLETKNIHNVGEVALFLVEEVLSGAPVPTPVNLSGPDDAARVRRLAWATLLLRSWAIDVLACPRCDGPMRMIAVIEDAQVARKILKHLGLSFRPLPRGHPAGTERQQVLFDEHPSFAH